MKTSGLLLRALVCLMIAGSVSACGFQPMYGGMAYRALPGLEINAPSDRLGYLVEDALRDHLGDGQSAYTTDIDLEFVIRPLGLSAVGRASRFEGRVEVSYRLYTRDGFEANGAFYESVYYDAPGDPFSLIAARQAAEERAADLVADQLVVEFTSLIQRHESEARR